MAVYITWPELHDSYVHLKDNKQLYFGDDKDANIKWDGSELDITAATVNIDGAVTLTGDISIETDDLSVEQGYYLYLDGLLGGEYIRSDTANYLMLNGTTGIDLAIGGTDKVNIITNLITLVQPVSCSSTLAVTSTSTFTGAATFVGAVLPSVTNTPALGSASLNWADLFLGDGAVINFNAGNMTITHSAGDLAVAGGTLTTAGVIVGTVATGISFTGTYTGNVIDFTSATIAPTGSGGPCFIRAGAYGSPIDLGADEDQSGMIRMYVTTQAGGTSYDRGLFMFCETTGTKGIMPVAGLAEVGAGGAPTSVYPCQFIAHLNSATASLGADGRMFGGWFKITANEGATIPSTAIAAPLWVDNQLYGSNISGSMEEYGIWATTGGTQPKAFIGFETTSSGYDCLLYWDETAYDYEPLVASDITGGTKGYYIRVNVNGAIYGIQLYAA